jgi:MFS family permease
MTAELNDMSFPHKAQATNGSNHALAPSLSSEVTITPARFQSRASTPDPPNNTTSKGSSSRLAGFVGMLTGCGALVALGIFLPLPARFQRSGLTPEQALKDSYYIVGAVAFCISIFCFIGFRKLRGEEPKKLKNMFRWKVDTRTTGDQQENSLPYWRQFLASFILGFRQVNIGLGYVGGFVARASSVGISLFIPLLVNAYFKSSGLCEGDLKGGLGDAKRRCPKAYLLAAELTGISQLIALLCAPIFGYVADRYGRYQLPLIVSALSGILGCVLFAKLPSPRPSGPDGSPLVFVAMALLGISQIGAIVCSLGLLSNGVLGHADQSPSPPQKTAGEPGETNEDPEHDTSPQEDAPLLLGDSPPQPKTWVHLKGSIAGLYSLYGGAGILLLTKLGGFLFDELSPGAPFYMLAIFNGVLLAVAAGCGVGRAFPGIFHPRDG